MQRGRVVVVGASGFVGGAVRAACERSGWDVTSVPAPRIEVEFGSDASVAARAWAAAEPAALGALVAAFQGAAAVVNAAGDAAPTGSATPALWGANAVLPGVVAIAAADAGVPRVVHVSSAAVQGSRAELDEQPFERGHSPYARSKGAGEGAVAALCGGATAAVVYRPTSVLGAARPIARRLAEVLRAGWLALPDGDVPLPVAHVDHVGDAVRFLVEAPAPPPIALHPWEGMTVRSLAAAFGRTAPFRRLPGPVGRLAVGTIGLLARGGPVAGQARRLELLWKGQSQRSSLPALGFEVPDAAAAFERLGGELLVHSAS